MKNKKILIIDDQKEARESYKSILGKNNYPEHSQLEKLESELFEEQGNKDKGNLKTPEEIYEVEYAAQGLDGVERTRKALENNRPFALAFIDMRMPPGIDGKETAKRIRELDRQMEFVIVTAYSDHDRRDIVESVGYPSKLLFLRKPFEVDEIKQFALALTEKWNLGR